MIKKTGNPKPLIAEEYIIKFVNKLYKLKFFVSSNLGSKTIIDILERTAIILIKKGKSFVTEAIKESTGVLVSIADGVDIPEREYEGLVIESYALSVARSISMVATSLGGLNGMVFTGNISQNSPQIRKLILDNLSWLGVVINKKSNNNQKLKISDKDSQITVLLVSTNEGYAMVNQFVEDKL